MLGLPSIAWTACIRFCKSAHSRAACRERSEMRSISAEKPEASPLTALMPAAVLRNPVMLSPAVPTDLSTLWKPSDSSPVVCLPSAFS